MSADDLETPAARRFPGGVDHLALNPRTLNPTLANEDTMENIAGLKTLCQSREQQTPRGLSALRRRPAWEFYRAFGEFGGVAGDAIKLNQIAVYHFAFSLDDLRERVEKLKAEGAPILGRGCTDSRSADRVEHDRLRRTSGQEGAYLPLPGSPDGIIVRFE